MPDNKTTAADFKLFKAECQKWIKRFGLYEWEIHICLEDGEDGNVAWYHCDWAWKVARVCLNSRLDFDWVGMSRQQLIRGSAFHEVCELVLAPLRILAQKRSITNEELEAETHAAINHFRKALGGPDGKV